jgi:hypothetical protein
MAFVEAFYRGRDCTRDKWRAHVLTLALPHAILMHVKELQHDVFITIIL